LRIAERHPEKRRWVIIFTIGPLRPGAPPGSTFEVFDFVLPTALMEYYIDEYDMEDIKKFHASTEEALFEILEA
jgi:hypothetical protein